jgi:alpha-beta hydrolase superfamily lysophospholipase
VTAPALRSTDGLTLHRVDGACSAARGTVLLVHGLGEHVGRYGHVTAALNAAGWRTVGYDQRGHGRSGGARGVIAAADSLLRDLALVIDAVRAEHPGPLVLLGHSMGGAVAARFVAEGLAPQPAAWSRPVDRLVLSSPALLTRLTRWQQLQLAVAGRLFPDLALPNGIDPDGLSHDAETVRAYRDDPLVHVRISARLARFIIDAGEAARAAAPRWRTPTLLMWGGADPIVPPEGSRAFAAAAPAGRVSAFEFDGMRHEIFNETERAGVLFRLTQWLGAL